MSRSHKQAKLLAQAIMASMFASTITAQAAVFTWTDAGTAWNSASNWSQSGSDTDGIPDSDDTIVLGADSNINNQLSLSNGDRAIAGITINNGGTATSNYTSITSTGSRTLSIGSSGLTVSTSSGTSNTIFSNGGGIALTANQSWNIGTGATVQVNGVSGTSTLTKTGAGTLQFNAATTYTGLTTVSAGTLRYAISNAINTGGVTINGGTLDLVTFTDSIGALTISSGTLKMAANQTSSPQLTSTGAVSLGGTLDVTGMGTTAGRYRLVSGTSLTGTFSSITGLSSNYVIHYGTLNANSVDLQRKADQSISSSANFRLLRGTSVTGATLGTLVNANVSGAAALNINLTATDGSANPATFAITSPTGTLNPNGVGATVVGNITTNANTTLGTRSFTLSNSDANAIQTSVSTTNGTLTVVQARTITPGGTVNFGRYLAGSTGAGITSLTSTLNDNSTTANATVNNGPFTIGGFSVTATGGTFSGGVSNPTVTLRLARNFGAGITGSQSGSISVDAASGALTPEMTGGVNAITVNYSANPVAARSFTGPASIDLGRMLTGSAVSTGRTITVGWGAGGTGVTADTEDGTVNAYSGGAISGLTLSGAASSNPTANITRTISGNITGAGFVGGTFTVNTSRELSGAGTVDVAFTANPVNTRTFSNSGDINLGRFMQTETPVGSLTLTSGGIYSTTASATVNSFVGSNTNGLTLGLSSGSANFVGNNQTSGTFTQNAGYSVGGSSNAAGAISGSFSATVTNEFGSNGNISVNVTGNALNKRVLNGPSTIVLGNFLKGSNVLVNESRNITSSGAYANTTSVQLGQGAGSSNGLSLSGGTYDFDGSNPNSTTRTLTGTLDTSSYGGKSGNWNLDVTTLENGGNGLTGEGAYASVTVDYVANVGVAGVGANNTFGDALVANIAGGGFYSGLASRTERDEVNNILGNEATIVDSLASTNEAAHQISMKWRTRTSTELLGSVALLSDVVDLQDVSGIYVLTLAYNPADISGIEGQLYLSWLNGSTWINAGTQRVNGSWQNGIGGSLDGSDVGKYGVDASGNYVWAVLNHNSEFSIQQSQEAPIPEPGSLALLGLGTMGLLVRRKK